MTNDTSPRFLRYILVALGLFAVLLVVFVNRNLAALCEWLLPGSLVWAHIALLATELLALAFFWRGLFRRRKHLLLLPGLEEDTPEARRIFARELALRLRGNPHIREAGLPAPPVGEEDEAYLNSCLELLRQKADAEIRQTARRVFLATSLSQNGRLDALIVLVSLCRLVWRVSGIYNQQPHPREVASLYWAVFSSTFLALSLEELDLTTEITVGFGESFQAMAPAGLTAGIPFAGSALQTFTNSVIDGTANCYLTLRAGIITRNAYAYGALGQKRPGRAAVFKEAGAMLLEMSRELVERLAASLAENLTGVVRSAGGKTLQAGKDLVGGIGAGAGKMASGTASVVQGTGKGIYRAGAATGTAVGAAADKVLEGAAFVVQGTGKGIIHAGKKTGVILGDTVRLTARTGEKIVKAPFRLLTRLKKKD